ncbi:ABC transporter permease [Mesoplasma seiffertii]|uniref:ABC transporter permease n=1 Tax=Mesoplasma seiffertii TaxID=28224 RepID=UPI00047B89F5|nr:ABC transporter permease [Mesoplasma seiffertii]
MASNLKTENKAVLSETKKIQTATNMKKGSTVSFYRLLSYFIKLIFIDKAFLIIFGIGIAFGIGFGILASVQKSPITIFNWYYLINTVLLLLLIARLVTYFLHNKFEDQTMTIIIQQKTKRIYILLSIWLAIFLSVLVLNLIATMAMVLLNVSNLYSIHYLMVNIIYQTACSVFLISFMFFLTLTCKQQIVSIILSFVLLSLFISSLPQQFYDTKMNNTQITFVDKNGGQIIYKASEINEAIAFNENVSKGQIRFPHLSKYINDYYIKNHYTIANFENKSEIQSRLKMWSDLNLINTREETIIIGGQDSTQLKIESINARSGLEGFEKDDIVEINLVFKNKFKSINEIKQLEKNEKNSAKKSILKDLVSFYDYYDATFKAAYQNLNTSNKVLEKMWSINYSNFGKYLSLQLVSDESVITVVDNVGGVQTKKGASANISNGLFQTYLFNNYFASSSSKNYDLLFATERSSGEYADNYKMLIDSISREMYFELFIRVLEDNFINQTSNYVIITESQVINNDQYKAYESYANNFNLLSLGLFPANMNSYFETFAGKAWDQYWFNFNSKSFIDFKTQDNIFFTKVKFKFAVNDQTRQITGVDRPNIHFYVGTQVIFLIITATSSIIMFIRKDLK